MDTLFVNAFFWGFLEWSRFIHPQKNVNLHSTQHWGSDVWRHASKRCDLHCHWQQGLWNHVGAGAGLLQSFTQWLGLRENLQKIMVCVCSYFFHPPHCSYVFSSVYLWFLRQSNPIIHFPLLQWGETWSHVYPRNSMISIIDTVARSLTELPFTHRSTIGCG